jgi:hypothetical protein
MTIRLLFALAPALLIHGTPATAQTAQTARPEGNAEIRILRFTAELDGMVPPPEDGAPFRPRGTVTPVAGSDPLLGTAAAPYKTRIVSGGDAGFVDQDGSIAFGSGEIQFKGVYPTRNEPTPVTGVFHTVMVEQVTGGTGAFRGARGYLTLNTTLGSGDRFQGTITGLLFIPAR